MDDDLEESNIGQAPRFFYYLRRPIPLSRYEQAYPTCIMPDRQTSACGWFVDDSVDTERESILSWQKTSQSTMTGGIMIPCQKLDCPPA